MYGHIHLLNFFGSLLEEEILTETFLAVYWKKEYLLKLFWQLIRRGSNIKMIYPQACYNPPLQ